VRVVSLDEEVARMDISVGFVKIDIEEDELGVLKGAKQTLKEQHPILSISVYHNIEVIDLPKWIDEEIGGTS
jgi:FkbM family methyltransferase